MLERIILGIIGFSSGLIVALGLVALILELNIISRYAGVTHTAHHTKLYEKCIMTGTFLGNLLTTYSLRFPGGRWLTGSIGIFGGIFVGSWIIALTEVLDIFPIISKKVNIKVGVQGLILATAVGKMIFSCLYYYKGW